MIKILTAGFPCTEFSVAQKKNRIVSVDFTAQEFIGFRNKHTEWWLHISEFEKQISEKLNIENYEFAMGLHLFFNCLIALDRMQAKNSKEKVYYLFENVSSMKKEIKAVIQEIIQAIYGGYMLEMDSALVSAQQRKRIYFTNIPNVPMPEDKGIMLRDVLESGVVAKEKAYCLIHQAGNTRDYFKKNHTQVVFEEVEPIGCAMRTREDETGKYKRVEVRHDGKSNALTTVQTDSMACIPVATPIRIGDIGSNSQAHRVYSPEGKSVNLVANGGGQGAKTGLYAVPVPEELLGLVCDKAKIYHVVDGYVGVRGKMYKIALEDGYYLIRKLTILECKRLQTVRDDYIMPCSATQNYKMLGNGWTIDVISHILSYIPNISADKISVLSMYDGMACGRLALEKLGANVVAYYASEIDKYCIQTSTANFPDIIHLGDAFLVRDEGWRLEEMVCEN